MLCAVLNQLFLSFYIHMLNHWCFYLNISLQYEVTVLALDTIFVDYLPCLVTLGLQIFKDFLYCKLIHLASELLENVVSSEERADSVKVHGILVLPELVENLNNLLQP